MAASLSEGLSAPLKFSPEVVGLLGRGRNNTSSLHPYFPQMLQQQDMGQSFLTIFFFAPLALPTSNTYGPSHADAFCQRNEDKKYQRTPV